MKLHYLSWIIMTVIFIFKAFSTMFHLVLSPVIIGYHMQQSWRNFQKNNMIFFLIISSWHRQFIFIKAFFFLFPVFSNQNQNRIISKKSDSLQMFI